MTQLGIDDFEAFFAETWGGHRPFPWQQELLEYVVAQRRWPDLVDIPTGLGKTATIDIAVFSLAVESVTETDRSQWRLPHRVVMVVDRRVIVDQAHDRADRLARTILDRAPGSVAARVRDALSARAGIDNGVDRADTAPLIASVLRGGIVRDETWARRPDVPAVIASTVDQVGSRLLFRGYGLSPSARPIHAGLLGNDTLYLLDEVHLARPFAETLDAVDRLAGDGEPRGIPRRFGVVQLSATPAVEAPVRFPPEPLERPTAHGGRIDPATPLAITARRLGASKPARLEIVKVPKDAAKANEKFAKHAIKAIERHGKGSKALPAVPRVAVMVNRVDTARRIAQLLTEEARSAPEDATVEGTGDAQVQPPARFDVVLLTGRMRAPDRDRILGESSGEPGRSVAQRLTPGPRAADERPLVVVATQSLEAGADFDFDVLVTECASLDALRQRFGRVDRDGQKWASGSTATSVVLCRSVDADGKTADPVYGTAITATWKWLQSHASPDGIVDFGYGALPTPQEVELLPLLPPPQHAPLLGASHLDRWSQTTAREVAAEPDVAQWLHGIDATDQTADVQIIWRSGLDQSLFSWPDDVDHAVGPDEDRRVALVAEALEAVPPLAGEALAVPIGEARRWLRYREGDPLAADAPATEHDAPVRDSRPGIRRRVARWTPDGVALVGAGQIAPGDTIVVPATFGGITSGNWNPTAGVRVADLSAELSRRVRGIATVLLTPAAMDAGSGIEPLPWPDPDELELLRRAERPVDPVEIVQTNLDRFDLAGLELRHWRSFPVPTAIAEDGAVHRDYLVTANIVAPSPADDLVTDSADDALSLIGRQTRLKNHLTGVGSIARQFASSLGWDDDLARAAELAGELHDAGKADSRFQRMLAAGKTPTDLLAKSGSSTGDRASRQAARRAAGYPRGARHELQSLALIDGHGDIADGDWDLVRHLVATHHGWGRYRFRPTFDPYPEQVRVRIKTTAAGEGSFVATSDHRLFEVGSGHSERFWDLTHRYGWWTLAYLEAILRLADHRRSHLEQRGLAEPDAYMLEDGA